LRCIENILVNNLKLGEFEKNMLKTRKSPSPFTQEKNWALHECMPSLLIGCMKLFFG
jgi:hypothetical protein